MTKEERNTLMVFLFGDEGWAIKFKFVTLEHDRATYFDPVPSRHELEQDVFMTKDMYQEELTKSLCKYEGVHRPGCYHRPRL